MQKQFKYLGFITAFFVTVLLVSNIASSKILILGPFTFDGGTILFPLSYIFGDILTEVYGYGRSRKVIWTGFFMILLASIVFMVVQKLPPAPDWNGQAAYDQILGLTPRIVAASMCAYFAGEFSNSYILAKMKIWMKGKFLWMRTIGSTLIGEGFDTVIFVMLAFFGVEGFGTDLLITIIISNYVFKVLVEILFTPVTYAAVKLLKKHEEEDHFDHETNFNPFKIG
ncbi:MAG: hypothetical protein US89_C0016G0032 [Candidatus Peregrinibacteria bacterium GW2011_GWF2_38_29]|nr:MAG: hypothetical protein US89_C0016G0032 [Candidatus Peregrinibacteria bacterium GW2011_GWF2_38_29]HBB03144.1 transporter [Candidatus Peregrinibacteria bacterium]